MTARNIICGLLLIPIMWGVKEYSGACIQITAICSFSFAWQQFSGPPLSSIGAASGQEAARYRA
jgi:hypothetical protein